LVIEEDAMRKSIALAAAIAAFAFAGFGNAADMPARMPVKAAPIAPPVFNWTGIYVGINGGGAWGREGWLDNAAVGLGTPFGFRPDGGVFGGQVGFRWQWNQLVLGVEGTWDWAGLRDSFTGAPYTDELKIKSLYTATGQVGWAWDRILIYGKGGWAGASTGAEVTTSPSFGGASNSQTVSGWTVGGGVDYAIWQNVILGVEYDHFDFKYDPFIAPWSTGGAPWTVINTSRLKVDQMIARLSYKFDWPR
jgi:outer membrane immunogenic protein